MWGTPKHRPSFMTRRARGTMTEFMKIVPVPLGYTARKPASSAVLFRPENHAIIGPFIVAPCRANTAGTGAFRSWPFGAWTT